MELPALDLFSCAGGATRGYQLAGFHVTGVDIEPRKDYCGDEFVQGDAIEYLAKHWHKYSFIHLSPPCQEDCALIVGNQNATRGNHKSLIPALREILPDVSIPYVIEQPAGRAAIRRDLRLHGDMFNLDVKRVRYFEFGNMPIPEPPVQKPSRGRVRGWRHGQYFDGPYVAVYGKGGGKASLEEAQKAMGMEWVTEYDALTEAIPPAYTKFIGEHVKAFILG